MLFQPKKSVVFFIGASDGRQVSAEASHMIGRTGFSHCVIVAELRDRQITLVEMFGYASHIHQPFESRPRPVHDDQTLP
jgi:hypothetical protein